MPPADTSPTRFRSLHRKLEKAVAHLERIDDVPRALSAILEQLCEEFAAELGFEGGRIYTREGDDFVLCCGFGTSRDAPMGLRVPREYPPHRRLLADGMVVMARGEPGVDDTFEETIGVHSSFAAIGVGEGTTQIIAFSVAGDAPREDLLFSLGLVRHVLNLKLQQWRMTGLMDATRLVQEGILPRDSPGLSGFEITSVARPADRVSGDVFDYMRVSECCVGMAIADSSGHGLPAALLGRDVITALRTAVGRGDSTSAIVTRVNAVIQRAALSGTFVSLFYGQISESGVLEYCNAGHDPPLLITTKGVERLETGGTVLGPIPMAQYESGCAQLDPGAMLVLYTDGIPERVNTSGEFYGQERLEGTARRVHGRSARDAGEAIMADVDEFAGAARVTDDMTLLIVRRPAA